MRRCNFDIPEEQEDYIDRIAKRGLTRSQVVQIALRAGLPKADEATKGGVVDAIAKQLPDEDSESINSASAKRRS